MAGFNEYSVHYTEISQRKGRNFFILSLFFLYQNFISLLYPNLILRYTTHMETLIHADIFFFISTIAIVFFVIGFIIFTVYFVHILNDLKHISSTMRKEGDKLAEDVDVLREKAKEEGVKIKSILDFFLELFTRRQKLGSGKRSSRSKAE